MATAHSTHYSEEVHRSARVVAGGSILETVGGAGAVVLSVLALAGVLPLVFAAIATIAVGAALLFEGGSIVSRYAQLEAETAGDTRLANTSLGSGMAAESLGGIAGIVLGILALLGVSPVVLLAAAAIAVGAALLVGTEAVSRLNALEVLGGHVPDKAHRLTRQAVTASSGGQVLAGIGAAVLGILALLSIEPLTLVLVALLTLGASTLLSGSALSGKMITVERD